MNLPFEKYQASGNDFILINDKFQKFPLHNSNRIRFLCDRKFGIGADGLIIIRNHSSFFISTSFKLLS